MVDKPRLLCVDDEPSILESIKLSLRKRYVITTATSGAEALALFEGSETSPFDVVVSDMRMPGMTGAQLLTALRQAYPDTPRLLLSGQSDFDSALEAVNEAKIFRFLTKPCPREVLVEAIDEALEQSRLRTVEKELLTKTLWGTVAMLTDVLGLVNTGAYGRTMRLKETVSGICGALGQPVAWDLALATMLSQLGFVVVPADEGGSLELNARHVEVAGELLARIPRLESVAAIISHQVDAEPLRSERDVAAWPSADLNAEILRCAVLLDALASEGCSRAEIHDRLSNKPGTVPPFVLDAFEQLTPDTESMVEVTTTIDRLLPGLVLTRHVRSSTGPMLVGAETVLTTALIERIKAFDRSSGVEQPISVLAPASSVAKLS